MRDEIMKLLTEFDHKESEDGVDAILAKWRSNKANLINILSRHPNWDAENYRIVFDQDFTRDFDRNAIPQFMNWLLNNCTKVMNNYTDVAKELRYNYDIVHNANAHINRIRRIARDHSIIDPYITIMYKGEEYASLENLDAYLTAETTKYESYELPNEEVVYLLEDDYHTLMQIRLWMITIAKNETNQLSEDVVNSLKDIIPDISVSEGLRINKAIQRLCKKYGYDKITDIQDIRWTDDHGVEHTRQKDFGYNAKIAELGDKINPLVIRRHTIISVNPLDYLTMSFGHKWASCHTIDRENERRADNGYQGQYCSGTLSYMLDSSSIIFYTVDADYDGRAYETQDKMQRCMFHVNENGTAMIQGRVYPDGRDGGDQGYASQFRAVMQKVIADCYENNNMWTVKKGTDNCSDFTNSHGTHYRDYLHYDDCNVSLLKGTNIMRPTIHIGHNPICPNCGETHTTSEALNCEDCNDDEDATYCAHCGERISRRAMETGDYEYCEDTGEYFCCSGCAEEENLHWTENDGWHDEDHCFYDNYRCEYYYGEPEVETEDGNQYRTRENAIEDGYEYAEYDDAWYPSEEVYCDNNRNETFHWNDNESVEIDGEYYEDSESASEAGYTLYEGAWYPDDEIECDAHTGEVFFPDAVDNSVLTEDGKWFISEENAIAEGYRLADTGEWTKEDVA